MLVSIKDFFNLESILLFKFSVFFYRVQWIYHYSLIIRYYNVRQTSLSYLLYLNDLYWFRKAKSQYPTYVVDKGGYIDVPDEGWEYRFADDLIVFGGGAGQPRDNQELNALCQDVMDVAKKYSAKFIYTLGGFHTNRVLGKTPKTFVTTTSREITQQMQDMGIETTPQKSLITGFNGLILGFANSNL